MRTTTARLGEPGLSARRRGRSVEDAAARSLELLDRADPRGGAAASAGRRRLHAPASRRSWRGSAPCSTWSSARPPAAAPASPSTCPELEAVRTDLQRQMDAHVRTLDQLPTAVAIFDGSQRLVFNNAAYQQPLGPRPGLPRVAPHRQRGARSPARLAQAARAGGFPRLEGRLPAGYHAVEPQETWWHLPDRRTLRVVINPNPQGGVTYLFDDVSERFQLESQVDCAHPRAERDARHAEGRRRGVRHRRAPQAAQPRLRRDVEPGPGGASPSTRISTRSSRPAACWRRRTSRGSTSAARSAGLADMRMGLTCRMERRDGSALDCTAQPLPDGATLLTLHRRDRERERRARADRAQRRPGARLAPARRFRPPRLLRAALAAHQHHRLHAASRRRDRRPAQPAPARIRRPHHALVRGAAGDPQRHPRPRLDRYRLPRTGAGDRRHPLHHRGGHARARGPARGIRRSRVVIDAPDDIGSFVADGKRVRQILFNLLSNAVGILLAGTDDPGLGPQDRAAR